MGGWGWELQSLGGEKGVGGVGKGYVRMGWCGWAEVGGVRGLFKGFVFFLLSVCWQ